jgi:hypothetical protein
MVLAPLIFAGMGAAVGVGTMLAAGSDGPAAHVGRTTLVGAGVGVIVGLIACSR